MTTLIEEAVLAAQGVVYILFGRREGADYFDLGMRGLAGSFVAFLVSLTVNAYLPVALGWTDNGAWVAVLIVLTLFATQTGMVALLLHQFGRFDGLVPYLVADNWATFWVTLISIGLALTGLNGDVSLVFLALIVIVIEVNIARLIVTLRPLQIVAFLIAQLVGVFIGLFIVGLFAPIPVDMALQ